MESLQFEYAYNGRMKRLEDFRWFLEEFFFKQKYFFKHPDDFRDKLKKAIWDVPDIHMQKFIEETFDIASRIRFVQ